MFFEVLPVLLDREERWQVNKNVMDTKALRQKILDLAIHGKLVPHDPAEESSAELLKKICPNAEVVTEGVPEGWCLAKMQQLCWLEDGEKVNIVLNVL